MLWYHQANQLQSGSGNNCWLLPVHGDTTPTTMITQWSLLNRLVTRWESGRPLDALASNSNIIKHGLTWTGGSRLKMKDNPCYRAKSAHPLHYFVWFLCWLQVPQNQLIQSPTTLTSFQILRKLRNLASVPVVSCMIKHAHIQAHNAPLFKNGTMLPKCLSLTAWFAGKISDAVPGPKVRSEAHGGRILGGLMVCAKHSALNTAMRYVKHWKLQIVYSRWERWGN